MKVGVEYTRSNLHNYAIKSNVNLQIIYKVHQADIIVYVELIKLYSEYNKSI